MPKRILFVTLLAVFPLLFAATTSAQTGRIGGKVIDQQGGVLPGASVQLVNSDSGLALASITNAAGVYSFPSVDPGVLPLFTVGDVYASLCKRDTYAPFSARRRSQALF